MVLAALLAACGSTAREPDPAFAEQVSAPYRPAQQERLAVMAQVSGYWAALKARRWGAAYGHLTLDYREAWPFTDFQRQRVDFAAPRRVTRVHWLKNSSRMPGPELFAVVEWTSGPVRAPERWGRLVWRQERGTFLIQSSEDQAGGGPGSGL